MNWTQLKVCCDKKDLDIVSAVMSMLDNGLMIDDISDIEENVRADYGEFVDEDFLKMHKECSVSIFVPENKNLPEYISFLKTRLNESKIEYQLTTDGYDEQQWADSWKQYYKTVKLGKRLAIVPMWEEYKAEDAEVVVRMDPGMAFGTGTHETTRLCAILLEKHIKSGDYVLDVGTGSGILGIAASKLGASYVNCYDIDPVAVKVAEDNVRENGVCNITCGVSDLLKGVSLERGRYDLICANIVADIILRLVNNVSDYMKKGSLIICSGIIEPQCNEVREAFLSRGFTEIDKLSENDWNAIVFKK